MGGDIFCFSLKSVEMNGLSMGEFLFGMVILGRLFCPFGTRYLGPDSTCGRVDGRGG